MKSFLAGKFFLTFFVFCSVFLFSSAVFADEQIFWKPVTPAELQMKTPQVDADADAEAIFWEVRLDDKKSNKLSYRHYVRVKIFTERGREKFSKFDIPFFKGKKVENVAARVIKPDGSIIELQPNDIFERDILTVRKIKIQAKSFAVPGIEPGVIVEYQYSEVVKNDSASGERLVFQRDIPMQKVTYYVRPYNGSNLNFDYHNMPEMRFLKNADGFYVGTRENVPAFKEEPLMPPDDEVKQWVSLSYNSFGTMFGWSMFGNRTSAGFDEITKPSKEIKLKATELTATATTEDEKLRKIFEFTQKQIKNVSFDLTLTDEQREEVQEKNKKASDTLKRNAGDSADIDFLFAALAKAAGFDVNLMLSGDRSANFFNPDKNSSFSYVHRSGIAVKRGNIWKFYNPGTPYMPFEMIDWYEEGVYSMIAGGGGFSWIRSSITNYDKNFTVRTGKFKLLEDGTLEGVVRVEHNGQQATSRRRDLFAKTPNEREETLKTSWKETISTADISAISIENFNDSDKPYTYSFKVRIPNYAQKTGKRLFLQPGFFEYGTAPLFSSATRNYGIYFDFPWSENDDIEIELPNGFTLDNADAPGLVADPENIGSLGIKMTHVKGTNTLKYSRQFHFGGGGNIIFPVNAYKPIKTLFDAFHKADTHTVSLKQNNP